MMSQQVVLRPSKAFGGNVRGLEKPVMVQQRKAARSATAMATAALDEVPTPEKRVSTPVRLAGQPSARDAGHN